MRDREESRVIGPLPLDILLLREREGEKYVVVLAPPPPCRLRDAAGRRCTPLYAAAYGPSGTCTLPSTARRALICCRPRPVGQLPSMARRASVRCRLRPVGQLPSTARRAPVRCRLRPVGQLPSTARRAPVRCRSLLWAPFAAVDALYAAGAVRSCALGCKKLLRFGYTLLYAAVGAFRSCGRLSQLWTLPIAAVGAFRSRTLPYAAERCRGCAAECCRTQSL